FCRSCCCCYRVIRVVGAASCGCGCRCSSACLAPPHRIYCCSSVLRRCSLKHRNPSPSTPLSPVLRCSREQSISYVSVPPALRRLIASTAAHRCSAVVP
ncbi:hypothetical protein BVRB_016210, partial [Beta vulgaris subsp. vulgaris]